MRAARMLLLAAGLVLAGPVAAADWTWRLPDYVPAPRAPDDNPMSVAKVDLGRRLFYDKRLSGEGDIACASCHEQARAFTDGRALSPGATGARTHRNSPSIVNAAWHATYTWANPALTTLERQMEGYLRQLFESERMKPDSMDAVIDYLLSVEEESADVRLIMAGKRNRLSPEEIQARLRRGYGR